MKLREASSRRRGFTDMQREQLLNGHEFIDRSGYGDPFGGQDVLDADGDVWGTTLGEPWREEEARAAWEEHHEELETYWAQDPEEWRKTHDVGFGFPEPGGPGTRPFGWWMFEAPEARQVIGNDGTCTTRTPPRATPQLGAIYESERDFLLRHDLLTPEEVRMKQAG